MELILDVLDLIQTQKTCGAVVDDDAPKLDICDLFMGFTDEIQADRICSGLSLPLSRPFRPVLVSVGLDPDSNRPNQGSMCPGPIRC